MATLTRDLLALKYRDRTLDELTELNLWGLGLANLNILAEMPNLEVLVLTANCITSLAPLRRLEGLTKLVVKDNKIASLTELAHLKGLPKLRSLWIEGNPFAEMEDYRASVLRELPGLDYLDEVPVTVQEIQEAANLRTSKPDTAEQVDDQQPSAVAETAPSEGDHSVVATHKDVSTTQVQLQHGDRPVSTMPLTCAKRIAIVDHFSRQLAKSNYEVVSFAESLIRHRLQEVESHLSGE